MWWRGSQQFVGPPGQLECPFRLGADGEQPHPRIGDVVRDLRVGHTQLRELEQHLRLGSAIAPASMRKRGPRQVGSTTTRPDGATGHGACRSRAVATTAGGVLPRPPPPPRLAGPAGTPRPRRTSRRQLARAPSSMAMVSSAGATRSSPATSPSSAINARSSAALPARMTGARKVAAAAAAPATITAGPLSPPMASTTTACSLGPAGVGSSSTGPSFSPPGPCWGPGPSGGLWPRCGRSPGRITGLIIRPLEPSVTIWGLPLPVAICDET